MGRVVALAGALLCALGGTGLLMAALYLFMLAQAGSIIAAAVTGAVVLALSGVLYLAARRVGVGGRDRQRRSGAEQSLLEVVETARREIAEHPVDAVTAALVVGAVLGASPRARRALRDLLG